ncbi:MAG: copper-binding protein [Casimicrobiaceae bacterium]
MNRQAALVSIAAALVVIGPAIAQPGPRQDTLQIAQANAQVPAASEGEVRKIDKEAGKITIKHGPLVNLDMPAMTMVFHVKDPAMLDRVKLGDKIKFVADRTNGAMTVTEMELEK